MKIKRIAARYLRYPDKFPRLVTLQDEVIEFHKKFGHAIGDSPHVPIEAILRFRLQLIAEEFFEALASCGVSTAQTKSLTLQGIEFVRLQDVDLPEFIDALADLDYVIEGTRLVCGVDGSPIAREVHRANMAKDAVGDLKKPTKPPGWTPPDIAGELRKQGWEG